MRLSRKDGVKGKKKKKNGGFCFRSLRRSLK